MNAASKKEILVGAPVQDVWKALTDPAELVKWFPLEARVTPGKGGKVFLSWGPRSEGEAEIVNWEPGKALAWKDQLALVEFTLEQRGGKTLVRVVQSGFAGSADWNDEFFDSANYGWGFMLLSLQVALERHRGVARQVAWACLKVSVSREEASRRLVSKHGLFERDVEAVLQPIKPFSEDHYERNLQRPSRIRARPAWLLHFSQRNERCLAVAHDRGSSGQHRGAMVAVRIRAGTVASRGV
jgi:uncharacterized protein YndB with AHSA1/START domain